MIRLCSCICLLLAIGGCPQNGDTANSQSAVTADIVASSTSGEPPLEVFVSGSQSSSINGEIAEYLWDFAGLAQKSGAQSSFTFTEPGFYPVRLTVIDGANQQDSAQVDVRVQGGPVTAAISADVLTGLAPLYVRFDGTASTAEDDTIRDYYWEFGDFEVSRRAAPNHTYDNPGTYIVTLRAVSAGGVEGSASVTVEVIADPNQLVEPTTDTDPNSTDGQTQASLQFDGQQFATLPVTLSRLTSFTFEAWCKPTSAGGTLCNLGSPNLSIVVSPSGGMVTLLTAAAAYDVAVPVTADAWQQLTVSYDANQGATIYLNGTAYGSTALSGEYLVSQLSLGSSFHGNVASVRFLSSAAGDTGLLGDWSLNEGSGQTLANSVSGQPGTLGASDQPETTDPTWSSDVP